LGNEFIFLCSRADIENEIQPLEEMNELIERLIRARERRSLSLIDISYRTNIRLEILSRLENGDVSFQPFPYIKAMIFKYADVVGEPLSESDFEAFTVREPLHEVQQDFAVESAETRDEFKPIKMRLVAGAVLFASLAILALYAFTKSSDSPALIHKITSKPIPAEPINRASAQSNEKPASIASDGFESRRKPVLEHGAPAPQLILRADTVKHSLVIRTKKESCWVSVTADNRTAKEVTLEPAQSIQFNADSLFVITIGKIESAELLLNGKPVALPKRLGAIAGLRLIPPKD
jgi:cytoskeletal protein RodZ